MENVIRPNVVVLPESAQVPERNRIAPAPNQFTHEVAAAQPFYFREGKPDEPAAGELAAGAKVVLMVHDGGELCRVVDARGLYVLTAFAGLRRLQG